MIRDIDKSEVISSHLIDSRILESISTKELSGGVKTLILMEHDISGKIFNVSVCGDNCAKWILEIGKEKRFDSEFKAYYEFGEKTFEMKIFNTGKIVHNMQEFVEIAGQYV